MKRFVRIICLLLVFSTMLGVSAMAAEGATPWGSKYFASRLAYLYETTGNEFEIWIEVAALDGMDELGASKIVLQRSSNNSTWTDVKTYKSSDYPNLLDHDSGWHDAYVTYTGTSGYYYRAEVTFYAKKGNGTAEAEYTTESIKL